MDENEALAARRQKLAALRKDGIAYPNGFRREHLAASLAREFGGLGAEELRGRQPIARIAGRLMRKGACAEGQLATLRDLSGGIPVLVDAQYAGRSSAEDYATWDEGDIFAVMGMVVKLGSGELAVRAHDLRLLVKSLRPLPVAGAAGNARYADLIVNEASQRLFAMRARLLAAIRFYFSGTTYMEVETPLLEPVAPGNDAQALATHHNALDRKLYLRGSPGRNLHRLLVGGIDKVYEINRSFRDGPESLSLGPERTTMEMASTFGNDEYMATMLERMLRYAIQSALEDSPLEIGGRAVDLSARFARTTAAAALRAGGDAGWTDAELVDEAFLARQLAERGIAAPAGEGAFALQRRLLDALGGATLIGPTLVFDFAAGGLPPAVPKPGAPALAERFELYLGGQRVARGCSDLNDPEALAAALQDVPEAARDPDYLRAIEYGLTPCASAAVEIDLLLAKIAGCASPRDVILFPHPGADASAG